MPDGAGAITIDNNGDLNGYCLGQSCFYGDGSPVTVEDPLYTIYGVATTLFDIAAESFQVDFPIPYYLVNSLTDLPQAPNNGKPALTPQQKKQMICNTLGNISSGLNFGADALLTGAAVAGGVGGVLAINIEGGPISEGGAAVSFVTAGVLAVGGGEGKVLSWANTWAANKFGGCSISY